MILLFWNKWKRGERYQKSIQTHEKTDNACLKINLKKTKHSYQKKNTLNKNKPTRTPPKLGASSGGLLSWTILKNLFSRICFHNYFFLFVVTNCVSIVNFITCCIHLNIFSLLCHLRYFVAGLMSQWCQAHISIFPYNVYESNLVCNW